jgi:hypothetical protein
MAGDPKRLIAFCRAVEDAAGNGFHLLDKESLQAIYGALMVVKTEIENALAEREKKAPKLN